jgi:hypothetical protein
MGPNPRVVFATSAGIRHIQNVPTTHTRPRRTTRHHHPTTAFLSLAREHTTTPPWPPPVLFATNATLQNQSRRRGNAIYRDSPDVTKNSGQNQKEKSQQNGKVNAISRSTPKAGRLYSGSLPFPRSPRFVVLRRSGPVDPDPDCLCTVAAVSLADHRPVQRTRRIPMNKCFCRPEDALLSCAR